MPQDSSICSKHVLVIGDSMSLAHVVRAIVLARRLQDEGHRVTFATGSYHIDLVRQEGFEPETVHCVHPDFALAAIRRGSQIFDVPTIAQYVQSDLSLIDRVQPDLIISDMRMSLNVSAQLARIEYWNILSGYMTRYYAAKEIAPETFPLFRLLGASASTWIFPWLKPVVLRRFAVGFNRYRQSQGLEQVRDVLDVMESPYMNLVADLPAYAPCADLPTNFRYIGPLIWEPNTKPPSWLDEIDANRRTIYVTLGSTGDASKLRRMLVSLQSAGYQVLATTGRTAVDIPDGVFACPYAPGSALLSRSDAVICHGGSLTVYQAVLHGIPVVGIPTFHDQETNMDRVTAMGWGMEVSPGRWRQAELLQAVEAATTGRFQASVLHGQHMLKACVAEQNCCPVLATKEGESPAALPPSAHAFTNANYG